MITLSSFHCIIKSRFLIGIGIRPEDLTYFQEEQKQRKRRRAGWRKNSIKCWIILFIRRLKNLCSLQIRRVLARDHPIDHLILDRIQQYPTFFLSLFFSVHRLLLPIDGHNINSLLRAQVSATSFHSRFFNYLPKKVTQQQQQHNNKNNNNPLSSLRL